MKQNDLNTVEMEGRLTTAPDSSRMADQKMVCRFTVSTVRYTKKDKEFSFFVISTWDRLAEQCVSLHEGDRVHIVGRLQQERWQTPEGEHRSKVVVYANSVRLLEPWTASAVR